MQENDAAGMLVGDTYVPNMPQALYFISKRYLQSTLGLIKGIRLMLKIHFSTLKMIYKKRSFYSLSNHSMKFLLFCLSRLF